MNRPEVMAQYHPIREGIRRVLREATQACRAVDLTRAAKQVAPWAAASELEGETLEMLLDVALFEPNQRGGRVFDRFLAEGGERLKDVDRALAESMAGAWFSIFRVAGRHEAAGLWVDDLLAGNRRIWLLDEGLEATASDDTVFGLRMFDTGPFHAGFGIAVTPDAETLDMCVTAKEHGKPMPFRHSLAATLYNDQLRADAAPGPADYAVLEILTEMPIPAAPTPRAKRSGGLPSSKPGNTPRPRRRR